MVFGCEIARPQSGHVFSKIMIYSGNTVHGESNESNKTFDYFWLQTRNAQLTQVDMPLK
jgi:hypothetical protein